MSNSTRSNRNHLRGRNTGNLNARSNNNNGSRRSEPREPKPDKIPTTGLFANTRMMHCFATIVGSAVTVKVKNGREYKGLLTSVNPECNIILSTANAVDPEKPNAPIDASKVIGSMVIERERLVSLQALNVELEHGREFATDSVIAQRHNGQIQEKQLQPWMDGDDDPPIEETLESSAANGWEATDMFKTNAEKFQVASTYDPNMAQYTTPLPTVRDENYRQREIRAEQIKQEIEESDQSRRRSELENGEEDEESKYSAVSRGPQAKTKTYLPPQKRPGGMARGGRQQPHMDGGGRGPQHTRSGPQTHSQPPTPRTPPKMDANNPPRQNGNENRAERSQSVAEVSTASGPHPPSMGQGHLPMPAQAQSLQPTPSQMPSQAPGAMAQARPPLPQSLSQAQPAQPQTMPPTTTQAPSQVPSQAVPVAAAVLGGGDGVQEAPTQASATAGASVSSRNHKAVADLKKFQSSFILKCQESETKEGEAAGASAPKETAPSTAAKEEDPAEKELDMEGEKPVQQKPSSLNPNAVEFVPQAQQAQQAARPAHTSSPVVMPPQHQQQFLGNPQALFYQPQPQPSRNQYHHTKRAVVSLAQPPRQDFTAAAQHATGQPLLAQPTPMPSQFNQPSYIMPPQFQQNLQMVPHATRMNQTSLTPHQAMQPGGDPMQASSQHGMNPQHMFVAPPQHGPMPAHLPSHLGPMPAHVTHAMATGQQSTAVQQMTPVTGPPNPNSVQHGVGHQQPPPSSGTPQPGQMSYAQMSLPNRLGHQNQHATSPQPMQHYGMATSHAQPQQHMQGAGPQYTFTQQSQPTSSQAMQQYPHSQHGHHPQAHLVVMPPPQPLQGHMQTQFPSHPMPMPAHTPAPVIPMQQGIPVSGASGLQHHHMPYVHSQVASQHTHQVQGYHQTQ